jgi:hypothetical protein
MTAVWIVVGIFVGWGLAGWLTGHKNPWTSLWHWMRGHPIKATTVIVAIILVTGQLLFGWFVHKKSETSNDPCTGYVVADRRADTMAEVETTTRRSSHVTRLDARARVSSRNRTVSLVSH